ncbi:class F sortase [Terrabacter sp. C0L_2]|uniref:class F sortase n=1 Tax=Terrabacter sp. C0L_2 TaxID=3108389 RepID=UPI002ED09811|nr:class F sortase [Terrabacter sp. C0L_2]
MDHNVDSRRDRPSHRGSGRTKGVAAALAAALLAGGVTTWLTRSSDAATPPATSLASSAGTTGATTAPPTPGSSTGATVSDRPSPSARPATAEPDESAAAPERLTIDRVGIDMRIVPEGVARDGEMALPPTPATVGWYRYGPRPGDATGATVLAAHLDMPGYGVGPIAAVDELRSGDTVVVRSAGASHRYRVTAVKSIRKTTLDLDALFARDGPAVLHIVTCGGDFDREKRRYDENVVVTAVPTT